MGIPVEFNDRDLKRGILLPPAWYRVHIDSVTKKLSKDQQSTNFVVEMTVIRNADDGSTTVKETNPETGETFDKEIAGAIVTCNFNSKAPGFMQGFFKAIMPGVQLVAGERYDLEAAQGKEIEVLIENGEWQGAIVNRINHKYRVAK